MTKTWAEVKVDLEQRGLTDETPIENVEMWLDSRPVSISSDLTTTQKVWAEVHIRTQAKEITF